MPTMLAVRKPEDFIAFPLSSIFQGIHQKIEQQVERYNDRTAIAIREGAYSYSKMNGMANSLAAEILSSTGAKLGQVAILQPHRPELIISLLASLKAHKAYVPLDCNFPKERLRAMMSDSEAELILTDREHVPLAEELAGKSIRILPIDEITLDPDAPNLNISCDPMDRAYILYTSGTTGKPKGIEFVHRNLLHTTMCLTNELFYSPSDRVSWLHSPSFGSSIVDIYNCLTSGATLYPWDTKTQGFRGMAEWMLESQLTAFHWVPSAFRQFMRTVPEDMVFSAMRIVVMAGEPLTRREVELFRRNFPVGSHLVNQVGTAESYNYHLYRVDHRIAVEQANVPGGYPVSPDRQVLIVDEANAEVPRGHTGEIAIRSEYMAAGYWRNEELTRSKFVYRGEDKTPVYLTGDLGRIDESGCLIHLGRKDFQLKIRGCRVELTEIDHLLLSAPGVQDAITWVAKNRRGEDELVGYIVPVTSGHVNPRAIEEHLRSQLPSYMIPRRYVEMQTLPMLPTGKTDRNALPNPFVERETLGNLDMPHTRPIDYQIVAIFRELLQSDGISMESSFMDEGGDSLLAAVLIHKLYERFHVEISPDDIRRAGTPAELALLIGGARERTASGIAPVHVQPSEQGLIQRPRMSNARLMSEVQAEGAHAFTSSAPRNLVIIGAGQCGREVFTWALQSQEAGTPLRIKGFLDHNRDVLQGYRYDVGILATVDDYEIEPDDVFIGAIGNPVAKARCCSRIEEKGGRFINIIHPLANVGKNIELGQGVVLAPFSSITADAKIGNHVSIGAFSNAAHDTVIGDWCQISSHCGLNGMAVLGEGAFVGSHACVLPGVKVGSWAYVGAGSVVLRDVANGMKVFGNPAVVIGKIDPPRLGALHRDSVVPVALEQR